MDLSLSEEQELLKSTAREVLEREFPMARVRVLHEDPQGHAPDFWGRMAELGWQGVALPEKHGGAGFGFIELCLLIEELGRARVPGPFLSTTALGGMALARFGDEAQRAQHLPAIASGACIVAHATATPKGSGGLAGTGLSVGRDGDGFVLDGVLALVPYAHVADRLLVVTPGEGGDTAGPLLLVDAAAPGIVCEPLATLGAERQCRVTLREVRVPRTDALGAADQGHAAAVLIGQWGAAAHCAAMVGGSERVLELTTEYATQRVQFGRPIGSFQAVQHHCANMAVDVAASRYVAYEAIWRLAEGLDAAEAVAVAKAWVSDAYLRVCALGHQVHGAIGFTHEHDLHLYSRHAAGAALAFGDGDHHREQVCQQLGI